MKQLARRFLTAIGFLTRIPVPWGMQAGPEALGSSAVFFPLVGLFIGAGAVVLNHLCSRRLPHDVVVIIILGFFVVITGGLHEDALADAADGFGGGWEKHQVLEIMRDSRIGSFGALAIALGLLARFVFMANLPVGRFDGYLVAGQVTSRWTALPLAFFLPPARNPGDGQGSLVAQNVTALSLVIGTLFTVGVAGAVLSIEGLWVLAAVFGTTAVSGVYYHHRIRGVTGDCLGATNQITEVAVYFTGLLLR
jgi:adenosylcobinamide-GDP ribazoletransferase